MCVYSLRGHQALPFHRNLESETRRPDESTSSPGAHGGGRLATYRRTVTRSSYPVSVHFGVSLLNLRNIFTIHALIFKHFSYSLKVQILNAVIAKPFKIYIIGSIENRVLQLVRIKNSYKKYKQKTEYRYIQRTFILKEYFIFYSMPFVTMHRNIIFAYYWSR